MIQSFLKKVQRWLGGGQATPAPKQQTKRARPSVEQLDQRILPAVQFATFSDGTYAHDTAGWKYIAPPALAIDEGSDGTLFASFNNGTWRYNNSAPAGTQPWTQLYGGKPTALSASDDNTLWVSYPGFGTWRYGNAGGTPGGGASWSQTNTTTADKLSAASFSNAYGQFGTNIQKYPGTGTGPWTSLLTGITPTAIDASSGGTLYASFTGFGTYRNATGTSTGWAPVATSVANQIAAVDNNQFYAGFNTGTPGAYSYTGTTGTKLTDTVPQKVAADGATFIGTFAGGGTGTPPPGGTGGAPGTGTYSYNGTWTQLTGAQASLIASQGGSTVGPAFTGTGGPGGGAGTTPTTPPAGP